MNAKNITYQRPCPKIEIYNPDNPTKPVLVFDTTNNRNLLSYQFTLSTNDISGSFSLTFFPDYITIGGTNKSLFDDIKKLQIVKIYEGSEPTAKKTGKGKSSSWNFTYNTKPVFTGIIRNKKYVAQTSDGGGTRRLSVSGTAITGLVSQFYINLDTAAQALTNQIVNDDSINKELTQKLIGEKKVKDVINLIWNYFLKISSQNGTPKIADYITSFMGGTSVFLDVDNTEFDYPIASVFRGQQTQDFFDIIDGLIPQPVYEKFAYMDYKTGKMKIKIRLSPFDADKWTGLNSHTLEARKIKSFDLTESDDEVYTVFYAYLNGYPIDEQKSLVLSTMKVQKDLTVVDTSKYTTYGYRPLIAHFLGYGTKDGEKDDSSTSKITETTKKLASWYENLPDMLKGSISLAMTYEDGFIQPGEIIKFLGGEFYVNGITHNWNYGSGGEINLNVSRGALYTSGKFSNSISNLTSLIKLLQNGIDAESK